MAALRKALEPFNSRPVASLTRGELLLRLDEIQAGRGPIARNRAQAEIRAWLGWCCDRDLVPSIVIDRVKKAVKEQAARACAERRRDQSGAGGHGGSRSPFNDLVRVLLFTAMRRGEAANLQPRDLDFAAATIVVRDEVSKTRQSRTIPMASALIPMLEERARGVARDGYIFGDGTNFERPFSGFGKRFAALAAAMPEGEPWTLHDIRRTVATRLHEAGTDALTVEDLLGHSDRRPIGRRRRLQSRFDPGAPAASDRGVEHKIGGSGGPAAAAPAVSAETGSATANVVQLKRKVT